MRIEGVKFHQPIQSIQKLQALKARHEEVELHEDAHYREAGSLALSRPVLSDFVEGPDGRMYATGGHVMIDTSETGDPTIDRFRGQTIVRAAEAPRSVNSELSDADLDVAAKGRRMIEKSEHNLSRLQQLKSTVGGLAQHLNHQQVNTLAKGLDIDLKPGAILNFLR